MLESSDSSSGLRRHSLNAVNDSMNSATTGINNLYHQQQFNGHHHNNNNCNYNSPPNYQHHNSHDKLRQLSHSKPLKAAMYSNGHHHYGNNGSGHGHGASISKLPFEKMLPELLQQQQQHPQHLLYLDQLQQQQQQQQQVNYQQQRYQQQQYNIQQQQQFGGYFPIISVNNSKPVVSSSISSVSNVTQPANVLQTQDHQPTSAQALVQILPQSVEVSTPGPSKLLSNCLEIQSKYLPHPHYLKRVQKETIEEFMRRDVADWLLKLTKHMNYHSETFGIAMNLFDRCLSTFVVKEVHLQLIASSCFLIASKVGEQWNTHPTFKELCIAADFAFSCSDLERMEKLLLKKLNWQINPITSHMLVHVILDDCSNKKIYGSSSSSVGIFGFALTPEEKASVVEGAEDLCDSAYSVYRFLKYRPSTIAVGAILISLQQKLNWNIHTILKPLLQVSLVKEETLSQCYDELMKLFSVVVASHGYNSVGF